MLSDGTDYIPSELDQIRFALKESYDDTEPLMEYALRMAKTEYYARLSANYASNNRAMWTVTLERADGRQLMRECIGAFPDMTPQPEPEAEVEQDS